MYDSFGGFHVLASKDGAVRIILGTVLLLIVASLVIEQKLLVATAEFQKVYLKKSVRSHSISYLGLCILSEVNSSLVDWLGAVLRYRLGMLADALFTTSVLEAESERPGSEQPGASLETYKIKKAALLNFYEYSACMIPKHLLQFIHALYQVSVRSSDKLSSIVVAIFATTLSLYFLSFCCFLAIRKRIRTKINHSSVQKAVLVERTFRSFDCIKALGLEPAVYRKYQLLVRMHFMLVDIYHLASEFFRLLMRSTIVFAEICMISSVCFELGIVQRANLLAILLLVRSIGRSLLNLRNVLAMYLEYKYEAGFKEPVPITARKLRRRPDSLDSRREPGISAIQNSPYVRPKQLLFQSSNPKEVVHFYHKHSTPTCTLCFDSGISFADLRISMDWAKALSYTSGAISPLQKMQGGTAINNLGPCIVAIPAFKLPPGRTTCIIGADTISKNIIADCLLGMCEYAGRIEAGGQDLCHVPRHVKLKAMSYLPEKQELFCKSVIFNISYGSGLSEAQAIHRVNELGFGVFFSNLTDGYHTIVNDSGYGLSSGERQLICICRALIKDCPLYILDNPASFLDKEHMDAVLSIISNMEGKLIVIFSPDNGLANYVDHTMIFPSTNFVEFA